MSIRGRKEGDEDSLSEDHRDSSKDYASLGFLGEASVKWESQKYPRVERCCVTKKQKREKLLQVPMTEKEMGDLEKMARKVKWSKASVVRFAIEQLKVSDMKGEDPSGNRRGID